MVHAALLSVVVVEFRSVNVSVLPLDGAELRRTAIPASVASCGATIIAKASVDCVHFAATSVNVPEPQNCPSVGDGALESSPRITMLLCGSVLLPFAVTVNVAKQSVALVGLFEGTIWRVNSAIWAVSTVCVTSEQTVDVPTSAQVKALAEPSTFSDMSYCILPVPGAAVHWACMLESRPLVNAATWAFPTVVDGPCCTP